MLQHLSGRVVKRHMGCVTGYSCLILGLCLTHIVLAQKNNTSVGVCVEASNDDRVNGTVGMSKDFGNGVSLNAGGSLVSSGNRKVKAGISWSWRSSSKLMVRLPSRSLLI
ncbi:uncharacterized protein LOC128206289 [Mya arenaria]|uniref:uncharacterized protein LOC128206289 n=1 Tax=Mya arenaria TaxID=6604 RepID=UPI0022E7D057|nr:uncharacterized protein LOC128206289 [Mya arenaria]